MSHQLNFYALPSETADLLLEIGRLEEMKVIASRSKSASPDIVGDVRSAITGGPPLFYFLIRKDDLPSLVNQYIAAQGYWSVDDLLSPVVEFTCCFFDGKVLRRGRLYYCDGYYGADGKWVEKAEPFRRWAKRVRAAARSRFERSGTDYASRGALEWRQRGGGAFVT